jgi:hypothetical protein
VVDEAHDLRVDVDGCPAAAHFFFKGVGRILGEDQIRGVRVRGARARLTMTNPKYEGTDVLVLRRIDGRWLAELPRY